MLIHSKYPFCFFQIWFVWIISRDKHFLTSVEYSGLDLSLARLAFEKIATKTKVLLEVKNYFKCAVIFNPMKKLYLYRNE